MRSFVYFISLAVAFIICGISAKAQKSSSFDVNRRTPIACNQIALKCDSSCNGIYLMESSEFKNCDDLCLGKCKKIIDLFTNGVSDFEIAKMMPSDCNSKTLKCESECSKSGNIDLACESRCVGICNDLTPAFAAGVQNSKDQLLVENFQLRQKLTQCQDSNPSVNKQSTKGIIPVLQILKETVGKKHIGNNSIGGLK